jgi:glycine cleavage system H lipoate-binding protein/ferredoxin
MRNPLNQETIRDYLVKKYSNLPASEQKCLLMMTGAISRKICPHRYRCENCDYYQDEVGEEATACLNLLGTPVRGRQCWIVPENGWPSRVCGNDYWCISCASYQEIQKQLVVLTIDDQRVTAPRGTYVLEAAKKFGIEIPHFCFYEEMEPYGGCRLCMVEVLEKGKTRLQPACALPVQKEMVVKTQTERIQKGRRMIVELLLARCPEVAAVKDLAFRLGLAESRFKKQYKDCTLCGLCVRVCHEVATVGTIDFIHRGSARAVDTPFSQPSEICIGCGACSYVCPTGAMHMEVEAIQRFRNLPASQRKCRYMSMGFFSRKICPNYYECWNCEVDQRFEDLHGTHGVFLLKKMGDAEIKTGGFKLPLDRMYARGHVWIKQIGKVLRVGIDDFARQVIGPIQVIKLPGIHMRVDKGEPIWILSGYDKTLTMLSPVEGKIVDVNPNIIDNPFLIRTDAYARGWILDLEPKDLNRELKNFLVGRSVEGWLRLDSEELHQLLETETRKEFSLEGPLPSGLPALVDEKVWEKINQQFFHR